jgi:DNA-binding transcriptional LysR family regulator
MVGRPMKWDQRIGRRLKLHDLHVLLTVAELGSMGKAAGHLAVSQPSVSKAIADIEHAVGVRLLDRTAKGVELTDYGRALLRRGMGAFDELRQGIREIETLADPSTGEVRVGCPEAIATGLMLNVIDRFSRRHPRVVVSVIAANSLSHEFRLLRDRVVDFLIGALPQPFADDDLDHEVLYRDQPFFLCGSKHPLARRRRVMLADLVDEPWLLPHQSVFASYLMQAFGASGLPPPRFGVRSFSVAQRVSLLATNRFISAESGTVLHFNPARHPIKVLPVEQSFRPWPIGVVTLKNRTVSPGVQTFLRCIREIAKRMVDSK